MANLLTLSKLLNQWQSKHLIDPSKANAINHFVQHEYYQKNNLKLTYFLVGIGTFFTYLFFMGFLSLSGVIQYDSASCLLPGILLIGVGFAFYYLSKAPSDLKTIFYAQSGLCAVIMGQALCVLGVTHLLSHHPLSKVSHGALLQAIAWTSLSISFYPFYQNSVYRFLTSFISLGLIFGIMMPYDYYYSYPVSDVRLSLFYLLHLIFILYFFKDGYSHYALRPIAFAGIVSLIFLSVALHFFKFNPMNVTLELGLSLICYIVFNLYHALKYPKEPLILAFIGILLLSITEMQGLLLAVLLMTIGYHKNEKGILILGLLSLPMFLVFYYYSLHITLFEKSIHLLLAGGLLLLGRVYLSVRKLDKA